MTDTSIQWTDKTWNPIRGCSLVSPGCTNCYAMRVAHRFSGKGGTYEGLTKATSHGPVWTGEVRPVPDLLDAPLRWKKPQRIFVNSMSDLFHEDVPDDFIDRVFAVMSLARRHTFQILTKRPERMRAYASSLTWARLIECCNLSVKGEKHGPDGYSLASIDSITRKSRFVDGEKGAYGPLSKPPLPNVWLGVSVENQAAADERIPLLLQTPAAVHFLSCEPLLGPVDLEAITVPDAHAGKYAGHGYTFNALRRDDDLTLFNAPSHIDWVIAGGESGPGARCCDISWLRRLVTQCRDSERPVFVKQTGAVVRVPRGDAIQFAAKGSWTAEGPGAPFGIAKPFDRAGGDPMEWPVDLRVREFPQGCDG